MAVPIFLVITGYVSAMSFERKNTNYNLAYKPVEIISKLLRLIIPFLVVFTLQTIYHFLKHEELSVSIILMRFITGGEGPGSYYFIIMIQVVLIAPIIWWTVKKYCVSGIIICFVINLLYELVHATYGIPPKVYSLLVFRYLFILSYGFFLCYIEVAGRKKRLWVYICIGVIGFLVLAAINYFGVSKLDYNEWKNTSVFGVLWIVPIMLFLVGCNGLQYKPLELLGLSSYNIYLFQLLYYWTGIPSKLYSVVSITALRVLLNIIICVTGGVMFYKIESPVTKKIIMTLKGQ